MDSLLVLNYLYDFTGSLRLLFGPHPLCIYLWGHFNIIAHLLCSAEGRYGEFEMGRGSEGS